jgi:hypothetical protein
VTSDKKKRQEKATRKIKYLLKVFHAFVCGSLICTTNPEHAPISKKKIVMAKRLGTVHSDTQMGYGRSNARSDWPKTMFV